ncbi:MAG: hypothetical protein PQJ44_02405 [Sphaerochaetaceae bacterium]|nr:hypothetical protein [Sphaerochaetaceae bacterium]
MNPLLYSSNEMFSSTELIRKSKMIFDKLLKSEVEKAIILRDGKPGFMLLEFEKYEELMKDYISLKEQSNANNNPSEEAKKTENTHMETKELQTIKPQEKIEESSAEQFEHIEDNISEDDLKKALEDIDKLEFKNKQEEKKDKGLEEFSFEDDLIDVVKEKKEQPLKEFWD